MPRDRNEFTTPGKQKEPSEQAGNDCKIKKSSFYLEELHVFFCLFGGRREMFP